MFPPGGVTAEIPLPLGTCKLDIQATLQGSLFPFGQNYRHPRSKSAEFCSIDRSVVWLKGTPVDWGSMPLGDIYRYHPRVLHLRPQFS